MIISKPLKEEEIEKEKVRSGKIEKYEKYEEE